MTLPLAEKCMPLFDDSAGNKEWVFLKQKVTLKRIGFSRLSVVGLFDARHLKVLALIKYVTSMVVLRRVTEISGSSRCVWRTVHLLVSKRLHDDVPIPNERPSVLLINSYYQGNLLVCGSDVRDTSLIKILCPEHRCADNWVFTLKEILLGRTLSQSCDCET